MLLPCCLVNLLLPCCLINRLLPCCLVDTHTDNENKLPGSPQEDALHSTLDLTSSSKSPTPQSSMGELNLSMLLPVPQSQASDKLKPIIEFLGEESQGKISKNVTSLGENLPIPKDARPAVARKMESSVSQSQNGIVPSIPAKQKGINGNAAGVSNSQTQKSFSLQNQQIVKSPSTRNEAAALFSARPNTGNSQPVTAVTTNTTKMSSNLPSLGNTEELVKSFLESKMGQDLSKSLLNLSSLQDSSYKTMMAQHFGSSVKPTPAPAPQIPPNKNLIANLVSGLTLQSSEQGTTGNSLININTKDQNTKKILENAKQGSGVSPTISIGNKVFPLDALSNALKNENGNKMHFYGKTNDKLRQLNEKIATLETLSDALDALTAKLSADDTPTESGQKDQPISLSPGKTNVQGRTHKIHHKHHHHKNQFDEDIEMLGTLLSRTDTHSHSKPHFDAKDQEDPSYIVGTNGRKSLNSADLEIVQTKINKAIEMAETMGRQHDAKQTKSTWLPLLVAGKMIQEEGAHTREEVTTSHSSSQGSTQSTDSEVHPLQEVLTRLIDRALREGTLNELVKKWDRSGSPFAEIAKNISLFLQGNGGFKVPLSRGVNKTTVSISSAEKTLPANKSSLTSQLLKGFSGFENTSPSDQSLFTKAVNNILVVLAKRQGFHKSNSTNQSLFETTDTLTDFKGALLGGRINKIVPKEDSMAGRQENKTMAENLSTPANKSSKTISPKPVNLKQENKTRDKSDTTINLGHGSGDQTLLRPLHNELRKSSGKEKLTFSDYDTKNVSRSIQNTTLIDFMNKMSETADQKPLLKKNKPGNKYSQVKPHLSDLMSVITASLLDLKDADQESSSKNNKAKVRYDESENERLLHGLPNDHKLSDYSEADAVLEAPNDHFGRKNSSAKRPDHLLTSNSTATTFSQNKTNKLDGNAPSDKGNQNTDLGDQTVTLTLETIDDAPDPTLHTHEEAKEQTGLRSNKVPHYLNIQSATTLGKINSTVSKNIEHPFHVSEVPGKLSEFKAEAKKPEFPLLSDGDGKLTTISPSPINGGDSQGKTDLPFGLQMNAIGRIADTDVNPGDLSTAFTSNTDFSQGVASKSAETKSFQDKPLPMASDLTSSGGAKTVGETETIVSKATSPSTGETPFQSTPERELPTASEVREMATSIKALLRILTSYSKRLKLEGDEVDDSHTDLLPIRSQAVDSKTGNEEKLRNEGAKINQNPHLPFSHSSNVMTEAFHLNRQKEETKNSLSARKYNSKDPYVNFPQSSQTRPSFIDNGGFENIQERPITDSVSSYNWNLGSEQAHAQSTLDTNPTKSSLQPQLGADQWSPANEVSRVTEELKDLNLPSIEDDPTVRAVQKIVAQENVYASQKRKAIQKHDEQQDSDENTQLLKKLGIIGRNTIPKSKGHQHNESRVKQKKIGKRNYKRKPNRRGRERKEIPRVIINEKSPSRQQTFAVRKSNPTTKGNTTHYRSTQKYIRGQRMTEGRGRKTQLVSSRNNIPGSESHSTQNDSVAVTMSKKKVIKTKTTSKKGLQSGISNANSTRVVKAMKSTLKKETNPGAVLSLKERSHRASNKTKHTAKIKKVNTMNLAKTNYDMHPQNDTNINRSA